jgi:hypothetical protein
VWGNRLAPDVALPPGFEVTQDRKRYREAQAVVFHIPEWKWKPRFLMPPKLPGQLWVALSMECEENYPRLQDPRFMAAFDLTMTYRLDSDVPVPYISFVAPRKTIAALRAPPPPKTAAAPVASFISSRVNRSRRREYARELMRYIAVDSYGRFLNNARLEDDRGVASKRACIARYKFTLAFENAIAPDYVTEKFFDPLLAGSVPVYLGAPNVECFAPGEHCFINAAGKSPRQLAAELTALAQDDAAYAALHAWHSKPFRPAFEALIPRFSEHLYVRLCRAVQHKLASASPSGLNPTDLRQFS